MAGRYFQVGCRRYSVTIEGLQDRFSGILSSEPRVSAGHNVMVLHPKIRWGSMSPSVLRDPKLQLDEAVSLVNTLPGHRVVDSAVVGVDYSTKRKTIWGSGQIEKLLCRKQNSPVSALMVNVEMLTPIQQAELYKIFRVPIYDRYNVVLSLFKHYATTEEAKLQIQLAELPYIRNRIFFMNRNSIDSDTLHVEKLETGVRSDPFEVLRLKEQSIRKKLENASLLTASCISKESADAALIAIVGYTNAGKTSLVKKLTGSVLLEPKDRLFATLDTTRHIARLPSGRKASFADTIGFFSDLPTHLLAAFHATLAHVNFADVIIHLRDVSHPAWQSQSEDVMSTLTALGISKERMQSIITVDNKIDRVDSYDPSDQSVGISCLSGEGIQSLIEKIDMDVIVKTNCKPRRFVLKPSSPIIEYLYREGFVTREPVARDSMLVYDVVMNDAELKRLQKFTGSNTKS